MPGDGYISPGGSLRFNLAESQVEYLWTKHTEMSEFVLGPPSGTKKNKLGYASVTFWTVRDSVFQSLRTMMYPDGTRRPTRPWLNQIDDAGFLPSVAW